MGRAFEVRKSSMGKTAAAKSKLYAKLGKEIYMAAKNGTPDIELNQTLKRTVEKAKKNQIPAEIIKRAIDKAKGGSDEHYTESLYEGFGPGGSLIIVECLVENANRAVAEVRNCFTKTGGKLGVSGSVGHQFNHYAVFTLPNMTEDDLLEMLVEKDIDVAEIIPGENEITIYGEASKYNQIRVAILEHIPELAFLNDEIMWIPMTETTINSEEIYANFERLLNMLDEVEDVQDVYHNVLYKKF